MDKIAVLDFGGQYAHLIGNRVRRLGVYSEIKDAKTKASDLKSYAGIILSGGPQSVYDRKAPRCRAGLFNLKKPILGICYGHQLMSQMLGGKVTPGPVKEFGLAILEVLDQTTLFKGLARREQVWMSHGDEVAALSLGAKTIGSTPDCPNAAVDFGKNRFGLQFHPEVTHTGKGQKILSNFLDLCGTERTWSLENFIEDEVKKIQKQVGNKKVFLLLSGGIDSTVAFLLLNKALGPDRIYGLFVDTGFLRLNEREEVGQFLKKLGVKNLFIEDASEEFFKALQNIYHPEEKRQIIGDQFIEVYQRVVNKLGLNPGQWLFSQGTIYPDTIETAGTKLADKIKTHHNRVSQIQELIKKGRVIEPIKELYKDEVRKVGEKLGLDPKIVWRHPFPGPGLAVRCLCVRETDYPPLHQKLEREINEILMKKTINFVRKIKSVKAKILPLKSVGVQGDARTYRHPVALGGRIAWIDLANLSSFLTNHFSVLNRVLYAISSEEIKTLEVLNRTLTRDRILLLQKADQIVQNILYETGLYRGIWQCPTILIPLKVNEQGEESLVLRPVYSEEAMTAEFAKIPWPVVTEITHKLLTLPKISAVFYDVTNKPPGTIEWE